jgi:hypothetical protein
MRVVGESVAFQIKIRSKIKIKTKIKGSGQECPLYTN